MAAQWLGQNIGARAADMALHTRRGDKNRYDIALVSRDITLKQDGASLSLSRLDATASVPAALMDRPVQAGDVIMLTRATMQRDALSLVAKGRAETVPSCAAGSVTLAKAKEQLMTKEAAAPPPPPSPV